ncbi:MAG: PIN domain-containing protein [Candidatus Dojkabacteria bacterium]
MIFIDTNILVRIIAGDNKKHRHEAVTILLKCIQGEEEGFIEDSVVAEVLYVLTSKKLYNFPRDEVTARLIALISPEGIYHTYKPQLIYALAAFGEGTEDFVDCLAILYMETGIVDGIASFDRKVNK